MPTLFKNVYPRRGGSQYYNYRVVVTENSQNVAGNTTNVTVAFSIKGPWDPSFYSFSTDTGIKIDGVTKKRDDGSQPYVADDFVSLLTWTGDVAHEANGQKTIAVAVWLYQGNSTNYLPVSYTESSPLSMGSVALTPIPRNSEFGTINNFTIENAFTVPVIKFEPSFFDDLTIKYGGITIATREGYINGSVTLSASELTTAYNAMSAVISAPWTFELITYSDSTKTTQIGSTQTPVNAPTATISDTGRAPSWAASAITASDSNATTAALTGNPSIFIAGYSTLQVSLDSSANPNKGATLGSQAYKITSGSKAPQYVSQSAVFPQTLDFPAVINDQYTATVTDSRGSLTSYTKNIDLRAYSSPNITSFSVVRPGLVGTSATLKLTGSGSNFGTGVTAQNSIMSAKYRYKEKNGSTWSAYENISLSGTLESFAYNNAINGSFDATKDYTFEVVISDRLATTTKTTILNSALVTMDIDVANRRVAIGKIFDGGANDSLVLDKPLAIANGGTGAATAAGARNALGFPQFRTYSFASQTAQFPIDVIKENWSSVDPNTAHAFVAYLAYGTHAMAWGYRTGNYGVVYTGVYIPDGVFEKYIYYKSVWSNNVTTSIADGGTGATTAATARANLQAQHSGDVLYSGSTTGTVTLSQSAANFTYLEIFYTGFGISKSAKIYSPNGAKTDLMTVSRSESYNTWRTENITISGTSITRSTMGEWNISPNAVSDCSYLSTAFVITRVVGYCA